MKFDRKSKFLFTLGLLLFAAALIFSGYNLWVDRQAGILSAGALSQLAAEETPETEPEEIPDSHLPQEEATPSEAKRQIPVVRVEGEEYIGTISVPSLSIELPVICRLSDEQLKKAPCRYAGSVYEKGFVIAGHNYKAHFSPLKKVEIGSEVIFTDVYGQQYVYSVVETEKLKPDQVEKMLAPEWDLTLFTCTTGGGERFTVRCMAKTGETR